MRMIALTLALTIAGAGMAYAAAQKAPSAAARIIGPDGKALGNAKFTQTKKGVLIELDVKGIKPGAHGVHIHAVGTCDVKTGFASAGGHFSPVPRNHGFMDKHGAHAGDMTNQYADANGTMRASILNSDVTLRRGELSLFDKDGSSIVIHADPDDYRSQPAGNAGGRVACGVINRL